MAQKISRSDSSGPVWEAEENTSSINSQSSFCLDAKGQSRASSSVVITGLHGMCLVVSKFDRGFAAASEKVCHEMLGPP